ncbi:nudix family [Seiridium cupressi]
MTSKASHYSTASASAKEKKTPMDPRPSSSIVLLSPTNQVLLLHRVKTSSSFASAHVFPGGNLSDFHDGTLPPPGDLTRHQDSRAYRLGAIRETFEESGILLARDVRNEKGSEEGLLSLPAVERDAARKRIYANEVRFEEWLQNVGGEADLDNLYPFTRWITPPATPRRFTTQMYLYLLPLSKSKTSQPTSPDAITAATQAEAVLPTPDGTEITTSVFEDASTWLARQQRGEVILFPPQAFLLTLVSQFCTGPPSSASAAEESTAHYRSQRQALLEFLHKTPTATQPKALKQATSSIPWAEKVISPVTALVRPDGRAVLSLEKPGPELKGSARGGDWERVVLVRFAKGTATEVEVRDRESVFEEERKRLEQEKTAKL